MWIIVYNCIRAGHFGGEAVRQIQLVISHLVFQHPFLVSFFPHPSVNFEKHHKQRGFSMCNLRLGATSIPPMQSENYEHHGGHHCGGGLPLCELWIVSPCPTRERKLSLWSSVMAQESWMPLLAFSIPEPLAQARQRELHILILTNYICESTIFIIIIVMPT